MSNPHTETRHSIKDGTVSRPRHRAHVPDSGEESEHREARLPRPSGTDRRAPSRAVVWSNSNDTSSPLGNVAPALTIRSEAVAEGIILHLSGPLEMASLLRLRDVAFTVIGTCPTTLCLDVRLVSRIEFAGINTLLTIGRVARLSRIRFTVRASAVFAQHLRETGLAKTLTLDVPPTDSEIPSASE